MNDKKELDMYFLPEIAKKFVELEQNEKNFKTAQIVDQAIMQEIKDMPKPIYAVELGGGAHIDRYHNFFDFLLKEPKGHIDWVDISPVMLKLAKKYIDDKKYQKRKEVLTFIESDFIEYLCDIEDKKIDLVVMKYTIDCLKDIETFFKLLSKKMKIGAKLIATISTLNSELKSYSTNARYFYNNKQFPDNETRTLKDGDSFKIKFFKVSGDPNSGYLEGAETIKYFYSDKKIKELAMFFGFDIFLGDWKKHAYKKNRENEKIEQNLLVLTKIKKEKKNCLKN